MKRFYFTPPSYSGHTLVSAILDAHPSVCVDNSYGGEISNDQIIFNSQNNNQWDAGTKYVFPLEGQGKNELEIRMVGRTTLYEDFENIDSNYFLSCLRHPRALFKGYVMKNRIPRQDIISYFYNLFFRISTFSSFIIVHEKFIHDVESHLFNLCSYLDIAFSPALVEKSKNIIKTDLPERDVELTSKEVYAIDEMIDRIEILGRYYGSQT